MNEQFDTAFDGLDLDLELGLQELEALEAPGWITIGGFSAGISAVSAAGAISATVVLT